MQGIVTDRTAVLSQETFKTKRLQEEILSLRRKVERAKKFELATNTDEVLMEEIKEYKVRPLAPDSDLARTQSHVPRLSFNAERDTKPGHKGQKAEVVKRYCS